MSETKNYIIKTASRLFLERTYKEVTMKDIVTETKLSKGAFYHYFESKEQLFIAVLDYFYDDFQHPYEKYGRNSFYEFYHDYLIGIGALMSRYLEQFNTAADQQSLTMNYFSLMFEAFRLLPDYRKRVIALQNDEIRLWTDRIRKAKVSGELKSSVPEQETAEMFYNLCDGTAMLARINGKNAIGISIKKQSDANTVEVCKQLREHLSQIENEYKSKHLKFEISMDSSVFTEDAANSVKHDLLYAIMNHPKKLSDFMIDEKINLLEKNNIWLLVSADKIMWVVGKRMDNRFKISDKTKKILEIRYKI